MKPVEHAAEIQSLSQCMEKVIANGFTANFRVENGLLHHAESGQSYKAEQVHMADFYRFEG